VSLLYCLSSVFYFHICLILLLCDPIFLTSYYDDMDDKNDILEKVERPTKEEMQARALREW
jgi:hypothetical protein